MHSLPLFPLHPCHRKYFIVVFNIHNECVLYSERLLYNVWLATCYFWYHRAVSFCNNYANTVNHLSANVNPSLETEYCLYVCITSECMSDGLAIVVTVLVASITLLPFTGIPPWHAASQLGQLSLLPSADGKWALAMGHRQSTAAGLVTIRLAPHRPYIIYGLSGLRKGDDHPTYTPPTLQ